MARSVTCRRRETLELMRLDQEIRQARLSALSRAYPLLKQAAELLELEAIEPHCTEAKRLRQSIGVLLGEEGARA
jgi:hypothetical protein